MFLTPGVLSTNSKMVCGIRSLTGLDAASTMHGGVEQMRRTLAALPAGASAGVARSTSSQLLLQPQQQQQQQQQRPQSVYGLNQRKTVTVARSPSTVQGGKKLDRRHGPE